MVYQIGVPPGRIDILTQLSGLVFDEAWLARTRAPFGTLEVDVIGRDKDRVDAKSLIEPGPPD